MVAQQVGADLDGQRQAALDVWVDLARASPADAPWLPTLERSTRHTDWVVLASHPAAGTLDSGPDRERALSAVTSYEATLGAHDGDEMLRTAVAVAGGAGRVVYVTDHDRELPPAWTGARSTPSGSLA